MRKLYLFGLIVIAALIIGIAYAEQITLSTYYPAPFGVYNEMRAKRMAVGTTYLDGGAVSVDDDNLIVEGNVGIGTTSPTTTANPNGNSIGNLDVNDVWLRDADGGNGRWASEYDSGFGNYGSTTTINTLVPTTETNEFSITQATTDLLVVANFLNNGSTNWVATIFRGYTGTTSNPNTLRVRASLQDDHGLGYHNWIASNFVMFVKKGEYYRITAQARSNQGGCTRTYCTIPIGN